MVEWLARFFALDDLASLPWLLLDIVIVYYIIYRSLLLVKGTRAVQMLVGLVLIVGLFFLSKIEPVGLTTLNWLLDKVVGAFIFILVVIFQRDIRRALVEVGKNPIISGKANPSAIQWYEEIIRALVNMSQKRIGAVIVIERETDLSEYAQQGVTLDAEVSKELLFAVFIPKFQNSLHDGALLIQNGRITAASCYLPLSDDPDLERSLGSRHRAAVGLSEETDAVILAVSEETGTISMAVEGKLLRKLDANSLREELQKLFGGRKRAKKSSWWRKKTLKPVVDIASPSPDPLGRADRQGADAEPAKGADDRRTGEER